MLICCIYKYVNICKSLVGMLVLAKIVKIKKNLSKFLTNHSLDKSLKKMVGC